MTTTCQSCGMGIDTGRYCRHCSDENGLLQPFDVRFRQMVDWLLKQNPGLSRSKAEKQAQTHMAQMPAWKDQPELQ